MKTSLKFILRNDVPSKNGESRIDARVYFSGKQFKFPTEKKTTLQYWNNEQGVVSSASKEANLINKYLSNLKSVFNDYIARKEVLGEEISIVDIRNLVKGKNPSSELSKNAPIEEIFDKYIEKLQNGTNRYNTLRNVRSSKKITIEFAKHKNKYSPTIDKINFSFLEEFKSYLKNTRGNNESSINKRLRHLRTVVNYAISSKKYKIEYPFDGLKLKKTPHKIIHLTKEEYKRFNEVDLSKENLPKLPLTKWLFIFSCETGLRYCDVMDLKWEHLEKSNESLKKKQLKTGNNVYVPLSPLAKEIIENIGLKKESKFVFQRIENQTLNKYLKIIAPLAEIDKHLTFHVSRHTFGSILGKKMSPSNVLKLLGDKDFEMANVYINADESELLDEMQNFWKAV